MAIAMQCIVPLDSAMLKAKRKKNEIISLSCFLGRRTKIKTKIKRRQAVGTDDGGLVRSVYEYWSPTLGPILLLLKTEQVWASIICRWVSITGWQGARETQVLRGFQWISN